MKICRNSFIVAGLIASGLVVRAEQWPQFGKLFAMSEDGVTYVIEAGPQYKLLGRNSLDEFTMASPAIRRDSLIVRTASALYCISGQ